MPGVGRCCLHCWLSGGLQVPGIQLLIVHLDEDREAIFVKNRRNLYLPHKPKIYHMPIDNYGVLVGTKTRYYRDAPDQFGKYYHGNIEVLANGVTHRCAIDVDTQNTRVQWRIINFSAHELNFMSQWNDGWHPLASNKFSGAIDYIRWRLMWVTIRIPYPLIRKWKFKIPPWLFPFKVKPFIRQEFNRSALFRIFVVNQEYFWRAGSNIDAIEQLESVLVQGDKVFVFGQFFNNGNGVHNIHQNQGDPIASQWSASNGIWQDGATIVQKADGNFVGFFNKFETQSFKTDDQGKPI